MNKKQENPRMFYSRGSAHVPPTRFSFVLIPSSCQTCFQSLARFYKLASRNAMSVVIELRRSWIIVRVQRVNWCSRIHLCMSLWISSCTTIAIHIYMRKEEFEHAYDHARVNEACASAYNLIVHVFVSFCAYMLYTMMHIVTYLRRKAYCACTQSRMYVSMYIFTHACMNACVFV